VVDNYLCNQCLSSTSLWVRIPLSWGVLDTTLCDQICQWITAGRWFSPGTPVSSTNNNYRHGIIEILLKVALSTINQIKHLKTLLTLLYDRVDMLLAWGQHFLELFPAVLHFLNVSFSVSTLICWLCFLFCSCYFHSLCTMHDLLTYNLKIGRWCISIWVFFINKMRERERDDGVMQMTYFFVKTFLKGYVNMESRISYFCTHMLYSVFDDNHNSYNGFVILLFLLVIQNFFMFYCDLFHGRSILRNF
jgi:hypothetical protein